MAGTLPPLLKAKFCILKTEVAHYVHVGEVNYMYWYVLGNGCWLLLMFTVFMWGDLDLKESL